MISSDDTPPSKRLNTASTGIDRISSLPESLIVHILSFLLIGDRIKTGALSRSWKHLWTCVPNLSIRYDIDGPEDPYEFVNFVDQTLISILCKGSKIKSFRVAFPFDDQYIPNVYLWTALAAKNGSTEEFELDLSEMMPQFQKNFILPQSVFRNSSFRELRFSSCDVNPIGLVSWKSLKKLSIKYAEFGDGAIEKILAGSPVLEILDLYCPWDVHCLHLGNSSVKKLMLHFETIGSDEPSFELSAPNLQLLRISGILDGGNYKLVNLTSLVEASVTDAKWVEWVVPRVGYPSRSLVQGLLENLLHVEALALGTLAIEGIGMLYPEGLSLKCKSLTLDTHLWGTNPLAIASLLENCPELEMLTIISMSDRERLRYSRASPCTLQEGEEFWKSHKSVFNGLKLLRTVKFVNLWDYRAVAFSFVEFLLEKASVVQKLIVNLESEGRSGHSVTAEEKSKAARKLLSMPRSSPDAKLVIYRRNGEL